MSAWPKPASETLAPDPDGRATASIHSLHAIESSNFKGRLCWCTHQGRTRTRTADGSHRIVSGLLNLIGYQNHCVGGDFRPLT